MGELSIADALEAAKGVYQKRRDLVGQRFGTLVVKSFAFTEKGRAIWFCACDCGNVVFRNSYHLSLVKTCGTKRNHLTTHGHSVGGSSPTMVSWFSMLDRCIRKKNTHYQYYGGRGIKVCDRWLSFDNFLADMGERPEGKTIERIDNNGNYEPSNC